jgi:curved DNA-binding protein CbpA
VVKGIFSGLSPGKRRAQAAAERQRLVDVAYSMHMDLRPWREIKQALADAGAPAAEIDAINGEAAARAEAQIVATVRLPPSAKLDLNYYFLLGVTPRAGPERIRAAYRRKAKEVHPDTHAQDLARGQWDAFMSVLTDANQVLGDPMMRRAYDILWRRRSLQTAAQHRRPGERRGDWETRYLWEMAAMAEREEALVRLVERLDGTPAGSADRTDALQQLVKAVVDYEAGLIELRTDTRLLPERLSHFSNRATAELQRKERLVTVLRELLRTAREAARLGGGPGGSAALGVLLEIRQAQHSFDLLHARSRI